MLPKKSLALLTWLTIPAPTVVWGQDLMCAPPAARPPLETGQDDSTENTTEPDRIEITAGQVDLSSEEGVEFFGEVEFRYGDRSITAENATYDRAQQNIRASGTVAYTDPDVTVFGEDAEINTENREIRFTSAGFNIPQRPARGAADEISIRGDQTMDLSSVNFYDLPRGAD